jgi:selenocysteine-specific elongation factor
VSYVVGTAGHIDHGKSTLVQALTGIDPDRLAEERRRGMTIDLGFAHLSLPSGRLVGIVDVPGHARFIRNMLAGVHGLDAVLLVVAADEGVMPQTREHLEIVNLLEIPHGLVALTKSDLIEADWLELVAAEVGKMLLGTSIAGAEILPVSAVTGQGLEDLKLGLDSLLDTTPAREDKGRPRLPVDRAFTISGFGTVVTGTLVDGRLSSGDSLELRPSARRVRVRGLQQHGREVEVAEPGGRVAVNLTGVQKHEVQRGEVLARPGSLVSSRRVDASVRVARDSPTTLRHGAHLTIHTGAAEASCRAIVLGGNQIGPGQRGWLQLYLDWPLAVAAGDRYVLRQPSPSATLAGGRLIDVAPQRHHRLDGRVVESLERRAAGEVLQEELRKYPHGITEDGLRQAARAEEIDASALDVYKAGRWLFHPLAWQKLVERVNEGLGAHHRAYPLRAGMPRQELMSRLHLQPAIWGPVVDELAQQGVLEERSGELALPSHQAPVGVSDGAAAKLLEVLGAHPFAPPPLVEAMRQAGASAEVARALARHGELVQVSGDFAFTRVAYQAVMGLVRELVEQNGSVTVASLRDRMGASRRPALALLEYLDAQRITRRIGDTRILR